MEKAIQQLLKAMAELGISPSGLVITYEDKEIGYPGGSYQNPQIVVTCGGRTERYDARLTNENPLVAATEVSRLFGKERS